MPAYGGVAFGRRALEEMAKSLDAGTMPMHGHHDRLRPVRTRNVRARAVELEDGAIGVVVSGQVPAEDWERLGEVRNFSPAGGSDLEPALWRQPDQPVVSLAVDAAWFEAEDIAAAAEVLEGIGPVKAQEYFQFSAIPDAKILIDAAWPAITLLGPGLACNMMWDAVKALWRRRRTPDGADAAAPTTIEIRFRDGERQLDFVLKTNSEAVAEGAIAALPTALPTELPAGGAQARPVLAWKEASVPDDSGWSPPV